MFDSGDVMKVLTEQLTTICSPFGTVISVIILHGRGQALLEMNSDSAVDNFLAWSCDNLEGIDGSDKLKFHNWPQCASAQRGKKRGTSSEEASALTLDPTNKNDASRMNSENIPNITGYSRNRNYLLSDEIISKETSRCLSAMIKKIVCKDSEERMFARRMRKKNHEVLLLEMHERRYQKELDVISTSNKNSIKISNTEYSEKQGTDTSVECIEKNEHYYNDWRNNKYCLNKEELKLICWRFVASGGNIEFCPYYKPNSAENSKTNPSQFASENTENKNKTENHQNSQISPILKKLCPLFHISRPVTECPTNLRALEIEDFFPFSR